MISSIRNRLKKYGEEFYMLFFLPMAGCVAMGISSGETIYRVLFAVGLFFLMLKFFVTDFTLKEVVIMFGIMVVLGYVFLRNRERSLILSALAIFGCKDVSIRRVLKYTVVVYAVGMTVTIVLAVNGLIPSGMHDGFKSGEMRIFSDYGFSNPNSAYSHLLILALMIVVVWREQIRWYHYFIMTLVMVFAYYKVFCRTGLLVYGILCVILFGLYLIKSPKVRKVISFMWGSLPIAVAGISYVLPWLYEKEVPLVVKINELISNRILLANRALHRTELTWFGALEKDWTNEFYLDNAYINILLSYGIIVISICLISYLAMNYFLWRKEQYYVLVITGIIAIYAFMEYSPINATWNPTLIYISCGLFGESVLRDEKVIKEEPE